MSEKKDCDKIAKEHQPILGPSILAGLGAGFGGVVGFKAGVASMPLGVALGAAGGGLLSYDAARQLTFKESVSPAEAVGGALVGGVMGALAAPIVGTMGGIYLGTRAGQEIGETGQKALVKLTCEAINLLADDKPVVATPPKASDFPYPLPTPAPGRNR